MKIDGIKGCFEKTRGLFYFARMCSKIRLHAQGNLPAEYHDMLGQGFDGRTCRYLRVRYEDVKTQVLAGRTDTEALDWCFANGRPLTDEEVLIYNSFMSKRGWHDDETDEFIPEMIRHYGLPDNGTVLTDFDLIEMDEGRWYPDMWRDAWQRAPKIAIPPRVQPFWIAFTSSLRQDPSDRLYEVFHFDDNEATADKLAALVLAGTKRATATLVWACEAEGKPLPNVGDLSVVTLFSGQPVCIIETLEVQVVPFSEVSAEFAAIEGEGDGSLAYWRRVHQESFERVCQRLGRAFSGSAPVVCEKFAIVYRDTVTDPA